MVVQNITFDESKCEIKEQSCSPIVLAKKKIVLPEKNTIIVNNMNELIITDSMDMISSLLTEQKRFIQTR